ncbi:MAG: hypothetical protein JO287_09340 [Pseudonocardiales bacterium]|nr:hypothetical protein [Pseudonocardiales bacterium]
MFFDPDTRQLLRTRPNPLTWDQARHCAAPARPDPHPDPPPGQSPSNAALLTLA